MLGKEILTYSLNTLKEKVDKADCTLTESKKYELNLENSEITLLRTTIEDKFHLKVIKDNKKGTITINKVDQSAIDQAILDVLEVSENSQADEAFDIAPNQETKEFVIGDTEPDLDKMYDLLNQYVNSVKEIYPTIKLMDTAISFDVSTKYFMNSNGVDFKQMKGMYSFSSLFSAKEGTKMSSFNYSYFSLRKLENELLSYGSLNTILEQTTKQIETKSIEGKINGDAIITPDCLSMVLQFYIGTYLSDDALISGTSPFKDKIGDEVASPLLTLHSNPRSDALAENYCITGEGFEAENMTLFDQGVLKSYLLSQYGANKTNYERAKSAGQCYIMEPGDQSFDDMVKSIDQGVLISRVSGGHPNNNGDLSVVLKNSFYIEAGEIKYPLSETTISINLAEAFKNIKEISKERVNTGSSILPYIKISDVSISGK